MKLTETASSDEKLSGGGDEEVLSVGDIVEALPKQSRRDATVILQHLKRDPDATWNHKGQLIVNGEIIARSHLFDLLKDAFYKYKSWKPEGILPFYKALADSNLPSALIKNTDRRSLLESFKNPSPPGVLAASWLQLK